MIKIVNLVELIRFYHEFGSSFFEKYNILGRQMLDFLHIIFDNIFYLFLYLAIFISIFYLLMTLYTQFVKKKHQEYPFNAEKEPFVTVQIPTYNELAALNCARRCLDFDYPQDRYEIMIGDDSSNPSISQKIADFASKFDLVRVIKREKNIGYKSGNLNNMLKHTKGDILVVFDSDFLPERDFLKRIVNPFILDKNVSAVQARWRIINPEQNLISRLGTAIVSSYHYLVLPFLTGLSGVSSLCGSAEAIKKSDLIKLGRWETGSFTEDIEFSLRLLSDGRKIVYLDNLECECEVPFTPKDLYKQQMRWAYGVVFSFREHFWRILSSKISIKKKFSVFTIGSGYLIPLLLLFLFGFGFLSFITHSPGPIDLSRFFSELGRNIILTGGFLVASAIAVLRSRHSKRIDLYAVSSFSYGLIVTYFVNKGIFKVLFGQPMQWFMLEKSGNKN